MRVFVYTLQETDINLLSDLEHPALGRECIYHVDLNQSRDLPLAVVQAMALRGSDVFPLVLVDGHIVKSGELPTFDELSEWQESEITESVPIVTEAVSAVDFPGDSRIHISLDVASIEASWPFYMVLFGARPTKRKDDYAKFELVSPSVNLALNQNKDAQSSSGHYGIQVKSTKEIAQARDRLSRAGFVITEETDTACCYAVQTKIWVVDPDGNRWEFFVVTEADADEGCGPDCICYQELERSYIPSSVLSAVKVSDAN